ncbi:MAG: diacylglycerol/polyprenol kinase family protein [Myxococcota bacterium]
MAKEIVELTASLYDFMLTSEPLLPSPSPRDRAREAADQLLEQAQHLAHRFAEARARAGERVAHTVEEASGNLRALSAELASRRPSQDQVKDLWLALGQNYEALFAYVRELRMPVPREMRLGHVKPRNLTRNVFHASCGLTGVLCYEFFFSRTTTLVVGGAVLAAFVLLDIIRRVVPGANDGIVFRLFGKISRPGEAYRVPAATWMMAALWIGVLVLPKHAIELGCLALAFGDPVASLVGKRWGTRRLINDKSVAGSTAFFVTALAVSLLWLLAVVPGVGGVAALGIAAAVAAVGAGTELFSGRLDDNFTIPLVAGLAAAVLL